MKNNSRKINLKATAVLIIIFVLFVNLIKSSIKLNERLELINESKLRLADEKAQEENLKREFARTQSQEFIEKQAREKLNMSKEGELIILLPTPVLFQSPTPTPIDTVTNFQRWVRLFL